MKFKLISVIALASAIFPLSASASPANLQSAIVDDGSGGSLGCQFLLCIASPNPMSISECKPPVKKVLRRLSRGKGIPICAMETSSLFPNIKQSDVNIDYHRVKEPTPDCPTGYKEGEGKGVYHQGVMPRGASRYNRRNLGKGYQTQTKQKRSGKDDSESYISQRVCYKGNQNGYIPSYSRRDDFYPAHYWYDEVKIMTEDHASWEFNVTIDDYFQKHRF